MENLLPQFQPYKEQIAEFVIKLYHILERKEYSDYLGWHGDSQIVIKQPKKVQEKVLPQFFRHRHLSSFIRQLNMYKFNKVIKLVKQKNHMYFKNQYFVRGSIQNLTRIKRNTSKNKHTNLSMHSFEQENNNDQSVSLQQQLKHANPAQQNNAIMEYKTYVQSRVKIIFQILKTIQSNNMDIKQQIAEPIAKCNELLESNQSQISQNSFLNLEDSKNHTQNMLLSMKYLPNMQQVLYPSHSHL